MGKKPLAAHPPLKPSRFARPLAVPPPPVVAMAPARTPAQLQPIPKLNGNGVIPLAAVVGDPGAADITAAGAMRFHAMGDTGGRGSRGAQENVAQHMTGDFSATGGGLNPAFCLHLGDVIYGPGKEEEFLDQFYRGYVDYPGKFVAIPGNHDGELTAQDPNSLAAFVDHFCNPNIATHADAAAVGIERESVAQPGAYWHLDTPFADIIGLYSNVDESHGFLNGPNNDTSQLDWLADTLAGIAQQRAQARKALIFAMHHPPYSNGTHPSSPEMLAALDQKCTDAKVMPDLVLSGHAHNYQRHTRYKNFESKAMQIPYIVAGCGGYPLQGVQLADGQTIGDRTFDKSLKGYGYLLIEVTPSAVTVEMWQATNDPEPFDTVVVDLATSQTTSH
jgi:predicted phosphodiesterase